MSCMAGFPGAHPRTDPRNYTEPTLSRAMQAT
jgi:hypothetical protein